MLWMDARRLSQSFLWKMTCLRSHTCAHDGIKWCRRKTDNAQDTLENIASGARYFVNDEEITVSKVAKPTAIIGLMTALIAA
jgi:hypothetical protein